MYCVPVGPSFGLRCGIFGLVCAALLLPLPGDTADARPRKAKTAAASSDQPRYAHIVVDANSGDVLHDSNPDSQRHPASLTKVMTLYLLFERMDAGRLRPNSRLEVSAAASAQAPSKLGLKPGQTIAVDDAIKALVTKSANDVAAVIAEAISGNEQEFALLMTRKARALGMSRTVYKNASGLPDNEQITTARDQALLAMAIQDRFPQYYRYFQTSRFTWNGRAMSNHNRLLGRVSGVDGIKTGYTRASGFNLMTSMRRGKRHIIAVVLGGNSAGQRDARMRSLIETHIAEAAVSRTAPKVAEKQEGIDARPVRTRVATAAAPVAAKPVLQDSQAVTTAAIPVPRPAPGSDEPIAPNLVKTVQVRPESGPMAYAAPLSLLSPDPVTSQAHAALIARAPGALPPPPGARPGVLGVLAAAPAPARNTAAAPSRTYTVASAGQVSAAPAAEVLSAEPVRAVAARTGWVIQVGAFEDENEARQRLATARQKAASVLGSSDPFTEPVTRGDKTLYRARFAGFSQSEAQAACRSLKRSDIVCMALRIP